MQKFCQKMYQIHSLDQRDKITLWKFLDPTKKSCYGKSHYGKSCYPRDYCIIYIIPGPHHRKNNPIMRITKLAKESQIFNQNLGSDIRFANIENNQGRPSYGCSGCTCTHSFSARPEIIHISVSLFLPEVLFIHAPTLFSSVGRQ